MEVYHVKNEEINTLNYRQIDPIAVLKPACFPKNTEIT